MTVTSAKAPGAGPPPSVGAKCTSLPCRVRPVRTASVAPARPLDEHLLDPADARLVAGQGRALDHHPEPREALGHDVVGSTKASSMAAARVPGRGEKMKV